MIILLNIMTENPEKKEDSLNIIERIERDVLKARCSVSDEIEEIQTNPGVPLHSNSSSVNKASKDGNFTKIFELMNENSH